ncbi:MAG: DUF1800 family protein, partial [Xanthomonadales bacterium]|nr:DUF1800 family protein [Xanthomonadales bacterium]
MSGFDWDVDRNDAAAARFLTQSTFGPTLPAIAELRRVGVEAWIDQQIALPVTRHIPWLEQIDGSGDDVYQNVRQEAWFRRALYGDDQLRQRIAFALSEIVVVSDRGTLVGSPWMLAGYYDMLLEDAFGNYRDL